MFCTTLWKRNEWSALPKELLASQLGKWKEQSLETHDIAVPVPRHKSDYQGFFRLLLLSPSDLILPDPIMARVERLYNTTGGRQVGIVFLLNEKTPCGNGTIALMNLQSSLLPTFDMPVIPLHSMKSIQDALFKFQRQLIATRKEALIQPNNPAVTILPYCSLGPPIPEHARNVLSDVYPALRDLAHAATTPDGQAHIKCLISEPNSDTADNLLGFWEQEFMVNN